jgi:hypothetical protein
MLDRVRPHCLETADFRVPYESEKRIHTCCDLLNKKLKSRHFSQGGFFGNGIGS